MVRVIQLKFRAENQDIFNAIKSGKKKIETRAATEKYSKTTKGDSVSFICGKSKFSRDIKSAKLFNTVGSLLKKYKPWEINPVCNTADELEKMYYSFPNYKEKIKKYGIIAFELK